MRLWLTGVMLSVAGATALAKPPAPNLVAVATRYIAAQQAVMVKGAGDRELEALMSFYAPDYSYYHPQFGAKVSGLEAVRRGTASHLGEVTAAHLEVKGILVNGDMVSLALRESFVDPGTGKPVERDRMTVLTIRDGKVVQRVDM